MFVTGFVNLYTRDIEAGIHFYRDLLGFRETFRTPKEGTPEHVELTLEGFSIGLGTVEAARRVHGVETSPGSPAMVLVIWTDDVDRAFEKLTAAGITIEKRRIHLGQPIKTLGKHEVKIKLHPDVSVELSFDVVSENPIEPAAS